MNFYTIVYHGLIFIPLTFLLALVATRLQWPFPRTILIGGAGLLLFALILEGGSVVDGRLMVQPQVIIFDLIIAACTFIFFKVRAVPWLQQISN